MHSLFTLLIPDLPCSRFLPLTEYTEMGSFRNYMQAVPFGKQIVGKANSIGGYYLPKSLRIVIAVEY